MLVGKREERMEGLIRKGERDVTRGMDREQK